MKKIYYTLIALVFTTVTLAQGIAVQGIARDNANAAISNEDMVFTFSILDADNEEQYRETETIRTDNFGIFSHIVSTGSRQGSKTFANIDFSKQGLVIKVVVDYDGNTIEVYNQAFQYTAYAHYAKKATEAQTAVTAANGVPPGTVVAFMGDDNKIPAGWIKCDGRDISGSQFAALRNNIGNTLPDLRARFLRGQGRSSNIDVRIYDETTTVRQYLNQTIVGHNHGVNIVSERGGAHGHSQVIDGFSGGGGSSRKFSGGAFDRSGSKNNVSSTVSTDTATHPIVRPTGSEHQHRTVGNTSDVQTIQNGGANLASRGEENRPWTVVVNYIIKL